MRGIELQMRGAVIVRKVLHLLFIEKGNGLETLVLELLGTN